MAYYYTGWPYSQRDLLLCLVLNSMVVCDKCTKYEWVTITAFLVVWTTLGLAASI
jgi:hypothetical protein